MNQNQQPMQFYCSKCQTPVTIYDKKCPGCGIELYFDPKYYEQASFGQQSNYGQQPNYGQQTQYGQQAGTNDTTVLNQSMQQNYMKSDGTTVLNQSMMPNNNGQQSTSSYSYSYGTSQTYTEEKPMKMKWYKFVIYVQLFLTVLSALGTAGNYMSGNIYGEYVENIYAVYGNGLKMVDMLMGVLNLLCVPMAIIVRQKLAHFKANGPKLYLALYVYNAVISVIYSVIVGFVIGVGINMMQMAILIVVTGVFIVLNRVYFEKRKHMFCN